MFGIRSTENTAGTLRDTRRSGPPNRRQQKAWLEKPVPLLDGLGILVALMLCGLGPVGEQPEEGDDDDALA